MSKKQKPIGVDSEVFQCPENIKALSGTCPGCGMIHYVRVTFIGNWNEKIEFIDQETYYKILREQTLTALN